jgi:hypothetical protein
LLSFSVSRRPFCRQIVAFAAISAALTLPAACAFAATPADPAAAPIARDAALPNPKFDTNLAPTRVCMPTGNEDEFDCVDEVDPVEIVPIPVQSPVQKFQYQSVQA